MELVFESFSELAQKVVNALQRGQLTPGTGLLVRFGPAPHETGEPKGRRAWAGGNYLDLFALGRLLALAHRLQDNERIPVRFVCASPRRAERLEALGFPAYCGRHGMEWIPPAQGDMELGPDATRARGPQALLKLKKYWQCLVPLTALDFGAPASEEVCIARVSQKCSELARVASDRLGELGLDAREMHAELSLLLFRVARELLSNAATHGRRPPEEAEEGAGSPVLFALTLSRENEPGGRAHRPGSPIREGQDKYELLVMDLGRGVARTVADTLNPDGARLLDADYFTLAPFAEAFAITRAKEEALLQNLFRGDLVIRKGRKSDGLHDLGRTVSWFGGILNYYTGRTELQLSSVGLGDLTCRPRREPTAPAHYLPGVVGSAVLGSHHVKLACLGALGDPGAAAGRRPCRVRSFRDVPEGFFGRTPAAHVNRKSEMDVEQVATEYERAAEGAGPPVIWEIDLKMSDNLDIGYLDHFIQELCKRQSRGGGRKPPLLSRLVFTNVPRDVVHGLKLHNCDSFLRLSDAWCLMLDEADEPHFLGLPRASRKSFDIEDAFQLVLRAGAATRSSLEERLKLSGAALAHLGRLLEGGPGALFEARRDGGDTVFTAADLAGALRRRRAGHLERLREVRVYEDENAAFRLANGTFVDSIYDFCLFWSDPDVLLDSAKLLLSAHRFPLVDGLIAFMNNGDRFASALQRLTGVSALKIVDPHEYRAWGDFVLSDYVVVVDALYDGDDEGGYVAELLQRLHRKQGTPLRVAEIIAFCDFRTADRCEGGAKGLLRATIHGVRHAIPVCSVDIRALCGEEAGEKDENGDTKKGREKIPFPERLSPRRGLRILRNNANYALPKPHPDPAGREGAADAEENGRGPRPFSVWRGARSTEMTTEFWQNVSAVRLLDLEPMERDPRDLLFYEYTERLVQNPRMRRIVTQFVSNYVRARLASDVDVILHPAHPIGAFVAQLIAAQLNRRPLILPVTQPRYGGPVEFSPEDYVYFRAETERVRAERGRPLRSVVLDDAVHTGRSLFALMGITAHLGLPHPHVFVLINRLPTEVSEAVRRSCESFTYLYRLNMPMAGETPDRRLRRENERVARDSNSYFAHHWAYELGLLDEPEETLSHLQELSSDPRSSAEDASKDPPGDPPGGAPTLRGAELRIRARNPTDTYKVRQIIEQLLLHPDPAILDFRTRLAVACNFMEQLVTEDAFWAMLRTLAARNLDASPSASQSVPLVSALVHLLSFSRHIHPYGTYRKFESLCAFLIMRCMRAPRFPGEPRRPARWIEHSTLVTECLMGLGLTGSERLWEIAATVLDPVIDHAMNDLAGDGDEEGEAWEAREAARRIVAAFAWSLRLLVLQKERADLFAERDTLDRMDRLLHKHRDETHLLLIDTLEPVVEGSPALRERLQIREYPAESAFLAELEAAGSELRAYLAQAPGYTCTLKTVLRITGADTVLLYMRHSGEEPYFLRNMETVRNAPDDFLKASDLSWEVLPDAWQDRMDTHLFFSTTDPAQVSALDVFQKGLRHRWCLGGAVPTGGDMQYYVVLGYTGARPSRARLATTYYYWLRCEAVLSEVLPEIHGRYLKSSSAWNALVKSLRPIHPIVPAGPGQSEIFLRRADLRLAMASVNVGDFVRRAVGMSLVPVRTLSRIRAQVSDILVDLRQLLEQERRRDERRNYLLRTLSPWPQMAPPRIRPREEYGGGSGYIPFQDEDGIYCAFHLPVLEFLVYEMLCNTLSYYGHAESIHIDVQFRAGEPQEGIERILVDVTVTNDVHAEKGKEMKRLKEAPEVSERKPTGVKACEMAAEAVGGSFASREMDGNRWAAVATLPAYRVPNDLKDRLSDYLR